MLATKKSIHQKSIPETQKTSFIFSIETIKRNTTFAGLQRKLGQSANGLKSIIVKYWLD
jgi:hypothetical protein